MITPLLVIAFIASAVAATLPDSRLHVSFLDVGEGDAALIQAGSHNILIDGGPSPLAVSRELSQKLPFWDRDIDLLILTHPHLDHLSGLVEVLKRYRVKQILASNLTSPDPLFQQWQKVIQEKHIPLITARRGQRLNLPNGAVLEVLGPDSDQITDGKIDLDKLGLVIKLSLGERRFLFTADIDQATELAMLKQRIDVSCDVLKVAHHGSAGSTSVEFLSAAQAQYVVISSGIENNFGHPSPDVLERLKGQTIYRTDTNGTLEFTTDWHKLWLKKTK